MVGDRPHHTLLYFFKPILLKYNEQPLIRINMSTTFIDITIVNKRPPAFDQPAPGFSINHSGSCYLNKSFFDVTNIPNKGAITV